MTSTLSEPFQIVFTKIAQKHFGALTNKTKRKVAKILLILELDPFSQRLNIKKMKSLKDTYRIRLGDIRIVYIMNSENKILTIADLDFRGNIY